MQKHGVKTLNRDRDSLEGKTIEWSGFWRHYIWTTLNSAIVNENNR